MNYDIFFMTMTSAHSSCALTMNSQVQKEQNFIVSGISI